MPSHVHANPQRPERRPRSPRVLLLVDVINPLDFPGAEKLAPHALEAARAAADLKARLSAEGVAAIYANDNYGAWQSDFHTLVSLCMGKDGPSGEITRLLHPQADDLTILKPRHSAFYASPLELLLAEMGCHELVICGLATDICVQMTAADAFLREFACWVPADCSAAETAKAHQASLAYMEAVLKCDTRPAAVPAGRRNG